MQEVQQLKKKLQNQEEELRCVHRSGKDLQGQLMLQTQTGHAAQKDATKLKVSLYTVHFDASTYDYQSHIIHDQFLFLSMFIIVLFLFCFWFYLLLHAYLHERTVHILMHALSEVCS